MLAEFHQYLVVKRDRDVATADAYIYDAREYIKFLSAKIDVDNVLFDITPDLVTSYYEQLRVRGLERSTIQRRMIGLTRFWRFCFRQAMVSSPPVTLDDMDIVLKNTRHPCTPLDYNIFTKIQQEAANEICNIY